jgi:hypothetical protein
MISDGNKVAYVKGRPRLHLNPCILFMDSLVLKYRAILVTQGKATGFEIVRLNPLLFPSLILPIRFEMDRVSKT